MEKSCFAAYYTPLVLIGTTYITSVAGDLKTFNGSRYIFNQSNGFSWYRSKNFCEQSGCILVSIESREEWNFLNQTIQTMITEEYFIGLRKDAAGVWRWLSDNSTINASTKSVWPWAPGQPSDHRGLDNCTQMYKNYSGQGRYNDLSCCVKMTGPKAGFICECKDGGEEKSARVTASTITGLIDESQTSKTARVKHFSTTVTTRITFRNTDTEYPLTDDVHNSKPNLVVIVVVLLAIFFLILVVAFGLTFFRRHRNHHKQCQDRVIGTYEKPSSSEQTSIDPVLVQQTQSSTKLAVHLTISRTESELATYETVSECQKERERDNTDETHRMSRSVGEGCSDIEERERKNTLVMSNKKGIEKPPSLRDEKEGNKDYVYAAVHKQRKGRASSQASALKNPPNHSQEGTGGLPGNRASCIGLEVNTEVAKNETPKAGKNADYLYAVVDKTNKKKKPPQMPPPYRALVYADLVHSRENYAKLVKEQSQTAVYAHVDQVKTPSVKISEQNHEETKDEEDW